MRPATHLSIVKEPPRDAGAPLDPIPDIGDLLLIGMLFLLNLMPVAGELFGIGHWSPGIVGFGTVAALLTGRELWAQLRARLRAMRAGRPATRSAPLRACTGATREA